MASLLGTHEELATRDLAIVSIICGLTYGFGWFTVANAVRQTRRLSVYTVLVWMEVAANAIAAVVTFLFLVGVIPRHPLFFASTMILWVMQVHAILQIIINRACLLLPETPFVRKFLRWGVFVFIACINVVVINLWIPAQLGVKEYITPNAWFDHAEKIVFLLVDAGLNLFFIRAVKARLISTGSKKYERLVQFNQRIMLVSLACDCFIIGLMWYPNPAVYFQMHPLAYCIKLNIELSMSDLIVAVATTGSVISLPDFCTQSEDADITLEHVIDVHVNNAPGVRDLTDPAPHPPPSSRHPHRGGQPATIPPPLCPWEHPQEPTWGPGWTARGPDATEKGLTALVSRWNSEGQKVSRATGEAASTPADTKEPSRIWRPNW